ncbi:glycosyltransferase [Bradyrhizobium sp. GCM10028915]|uniref:glycosyltransferase n=1 Tax=Bradyrhizobium sp. GCM10028915 TaxID=3273385 RepID=UPI003619CE07
MKVVHVLNEIRHSGAETMLASAATFLMGKAPAIVVSTGAEIGSYAERLKRAGYKVIHIPYARSPLFWLRIFRMLREESADVLHVHTERASPYYSVVAALVGIGCVRTIHNEFQFAGILRLRRLIWRQLARLSGTVHVAVSSRVARNEKSQFGCDTLLAENWYDPTRIQETTKERRLLARNCLGLDEESFVAVAIANEGPSKNLEALIKAIELCNNDMSIRLLHCGAHGEELKATADRVPKGAVSLMGTVDDIGLYLAACDAFVSPSFYEGGPIVLMEAAASGAVCITTRVGCAVDFEGLKNVVFVDPSPQSIAEALRQVARRPRESRSADGQQLAHAMRRRFTPEVGASRYLEIYRQAFTKSRRYKERLTDAALESVE